MFNNLIPVLAVFVVGFAVVAGMGLTGKAPASSGFGKVAVIVILAIAAFLLVSSGAEWLPVVRSFLAI